MIAFAVHITPVAWARPRLGKFGVHTHPKSAKFRSDFQWASRPYQPKQLLDGPIRLTVTFWMPRPKRCKLLHAFHVKRPDVDNLTKGVCDSMNGMFWLDDSQVSEIIARKMYVWGKLQAPGIEIKIERLA